jgi:hypothetical protein
VVTFVRKHFDTNTETFQAQVKVCTLRTLDSAMKLHPNQGEPKADNDNEMEGLFMGKGIDWIF